MVEMTCCLFTNSTRAIAAPPSHTQTPFSMTSSPPLYSFMLYRLTSGPPHIPPPTLPPQVTSMLAFYDPHPTSLTLSFLPTTLVNLHFTNDATSSTSPTSLLLSASIPIRTAHIAFLTQDHPSTMKSTSLRVVLLHQLASRLRTLEQHRGLVFESILLPSHMYSTCANSPITSILHPHSNYAFTCTNQLTARFSLLPPQRSRVKQNMCVRETTVQLTLSLTIPTNNFISTAIISCSVAKYLNSKIPSA
ncbi:unnamed protein product [Hydatigera taeniaeformis]|uniref:Ovule protein n=1 Tax=Hydatigena taeniaeformis TaxID=6205 RepID=A0A0R3WX19_HYDTA|nr:unnamed protein product [Hydatigera taeniaeformis]